MTLYTAFYDMDTNCVNAWLTDRSIVTIDCQKVEDAFADNMYERSELDSCSSMIRPPMPTWC